MTTTLVSKEIELKKVKEALQPLKELIGISDLLTLVNMKVSSDFQEGLEIILDYSYSRECKDCIEGEKKNDTSNSN